MSLSSARPSSRTRRTIGLILFFWAFYFITATIGAWVGQSPEQLLRAGNRLGVSMFGLLVTGILWAALRPFENRPTRQVVAIAFVFAVPAAFAYSAANYLAFYVIQPPNDVLMEKMMPGYRVGEPWREITKGAISWYFFIVAWATLHIALLYAERMREREREVAELRASAQTAELRALRYQVNPHFLFNTLNSLSSLILSGRYGEAERVILNMAAFFRASLTGDASDDVRLADEIELQRLYLGIERVRFPDRLTVEIALPDELAEAQVPGLILQPLIENAIRHGVARSKVRVTIRVAATRARDMLILTVDDDAVPESAAPSGHHVGLRNVCARLAARFGDRAACSYGPRDGGGFNVTLRMPLIDG